MSRGVNWHESAWEDYEYWQKQENRTLKKINHVIKAARRSPEEGEEPLKGDISRYFSRHINKKDVLVYTYNEDSITIIQCRFHYSDK